MPQDSLNNALRLLPSVDTLLRTGASEGLREQVGAASLSELARAAVDQLREELIANSRTEIVDNHPGREELLDLAAEKLSEMVARQKRAGLRRVINATGVILHTNLGRAPISAAARRAISEESAGYCTLEYDLDTGERGRRGARVEELLKQVTGAEDALVVNNCAAASLLTLTALASGGETIVSRGELVEIGGDFRVPDVMTQSGARLVEVGTTNRTKVSDFVRSINENTRLIMRVHPSNYRIVGFTSMPALAELAEVAHNSGLPLYEDAGSGALFDLSAVGLSDEPVISKSIADGADVVTFSGDKLLGGPQAGLIVGRTDYVGRMRKHPLFRALRADKLILAALEATLSAYARGTQAEEIPALRMLAATREEIETRAQLLVKKIDGLNAGLTCELIKDHSAIGGGSGPLTHPDTAAIAVMHRNLSPQELESTLRRATPPVIARIKEDRLLLDLRTVASDEEGEIVKALSGL
jgi:L-seryl-tRNA(Ser) seleniumtransferase